MTVIESVVFDNDGRGGVFPEIGVIFCADCIIESRGIVLIGEYPVSGIMVRKTHRSVTEEKKIVMAAAFNIRNGVIPGGVDMIPAVVDLYKVPGVVERIAADKLAVNAQLVHNIPECFCIALTHSGIFHKEVVSAVFGICKVVFFGRCEIIIYKNDLGHIAPVFVHHSDDLVRSLVHSFIVGIGAAAVLNIEKVI